MNPRNLIPRLQARGLTQQEIARAAGVTQGTLSRYASGAIKRIPWEVGQRLITMHARIDRKAP